MSYADLLKGRYSEPGREYFITTVIAHRRPLLRDFRTARLLVDGMKLTESEGDGSWLAWVIMPDHFHGLLRLNEGSSLAVVMNRFKGRTAKSVNQCHGLSGKLWQQGYYDHALRQEEDRLALARYIVSNPLRKGLVKSIGDYPHWDSVWL